jgi:hypothetical protein
MNNLVVKSKQIDQSNANFGELNKDWLNRKILNMSQTMKYDERVLTV